MDKIDRKMLSELQADGRISITTLAERTNVSLSSCHRRLRALEESGAIKSYRAQLDPAAVGLHFSALVFVTLREGDRRAVASFESAVSAEPHVVRALRLFGESDYLLDVVAADLRAFQTIYDERLSSLPGVQRLTSTLVMKSVSEDRMLPIDLV